MPEFASHVRSLIIFNMKRYLPLIALLFLSAISCRTQTGKGIHEFMIMSYNTENLYDTINDPHTADDEFTPKGKKHWNSAHYQQKLAGVARVISSIRENGFPDIVVLCEVENRAVLDDLLRQPSIARANYRIIHKDSRDTRGIDIAILYRQDHFRMLNWRLIDFGYPGEKVERTRGILYLTGIAGKSDTLHILGNHWKSRVGNQAETEAKRIFEAGFLKTKTDSILKRNRNAKIICPGDFNDEPTSNSINQVLEARCPSNSKSRPALINIMCPLRLKGDGTYSYKNKWLMLDNIIVSRSLLSNRARFHLAGTEGHIYNASWLLQYNAKAGEQVPFKTYAGDKYLGGYSDHLPVYAVFTYR